MFAALALAAGITIAWDYAQMPMQFNIYRDINCRNLFVKVATVDSKEYADQAAKANVCYQYRVTAVDTAGTESPVSNTLKVFT